jgi:hypothetical protein
MALVTAGAGANDSRRGKRGKMPQRPCKHKEEVGNANKQTNKATHTETKKQTSNQRNKEANKQRSQNQNTNKQTNK